MPYLRFTNILLLVLLCGSLAESSETISECNRAMNRLAKAAHLRTNLVEHHGGVETLGGFTTLDTSAFLTPKVGNAILREYKKLEVYERDRLQNSFALSHLNEHKEKGPVADFIKGHRKLVAKLFGDSWKWDGSSLLLTCKDLQNCFHQHLYPDELADPHHRVSRANAVVSLRSPGTIFDSPSRNQPYPSLSGETALFNEGAWHMSPPDPNQRLFLLHFFTKNKGSQEK